LKLKGNWTYNADKKEVTINLEQVQNNGSLFKMPVQIAIDLAGKATPVLKKIILNQQSESITITVDAAPVNIRLDPDSWVLMDAEFNKKNHP
jgi:hypothetical protein